MRLVLAIPVFCLFAVSACDSGTGDETNGTEELEFELGATLDNQHWNAESSESILRPADSQPELKQLSVRGRVGDSSRPCPPWDALCEYFSFRIILSDTPVDLYLLDPSLKGNPDAIFQYSNGDAVAGEYETPPEEGGFVRIDVFDETENYMEGIFEAVLVKTHDAGPPYGPFPDTLRFTEGRFEGYFENLLEGGLSAETERFTVVH